MHIDPTQNTPRVTTTETREVSKTRPADAAKGSTEAAASARFEPSGINDASKDIDMARVNEIRQAISEGKLEIRSERIADGLIASAKALIGDQS